MGTYTSIHNVKEVSARAQGSIGAPVSICLGHGNGETEVTFYTDNLPLSRRIASAINDAVKPTTLTATQCGAVADLIDVLWDAECSLDDAKTVLRAAIDEYENRMEAAYLRQSDEFFGPDDSSHRKSMIDAGRGHLLR